MAACQIANQRGAMSSDLSTPGAGGYAFMDDDTARALGLGAEHLIVTQRTDASGGWCPGAPRRFYRLFALSSRFGNRRFND